MLKIFYLEELTKIMTDDAFSFDVYVESKKEGRWKVWLIDINPWIPVSTDGLLFSWEELETIKVLDFRIILDKGLIRANDTHNYRVPLVSMPF